MKVIIEILGPEATRLNQQGKESRFQSIAVYIPGARFPKERKLYLGKSGPLQVGKYSLDLSEKITLEEGSENSPAFFRAGFYGEDLVRLEKKAA